MDWFRMYGEFASDPKVQSMSEAMQRRLMMLLCLRCSNTLVTLQDDEIAFALRISDEELALTKTLFVRKNFINDEWEIMQWDKRQFVSDSSAARVAKHRAAKKEVRPTSENEEEKASNVTVTPKIQNRTDTEQNKEEKAATKAAPKFSALDALIAYGVDLQTASDWLAVRKAKNLPATKTALDGVVRELTKAGMTIPSGIQLCCERGWAGFNPSWLDQASAKTGSSAPWWSSDALILAEGAKMGMKPNNGEYMPAFKGRVQSAIDNGGKPPEAPRGNVTTIVPDLPRGTVRPDTDAMRQMLKSKVVA